MPVGAPRRAGPAPINTGVTRALRLRYTDFTSRRWRCEVSSEAIESRPPRQVIRTDEAFLETYGWSIDEAWKYVGRVVADQLGKNFTAEAADIAADVMERLCTQPPTSPVGHPRAFFATCARRRVTDFFRRREALTHGGGQVVSLDEQPAWSLPDHSEVSREDEIVFKLLTRDLQPHMETACTPAQLSVWRLDFDPETGWMTYLTNAEIAERLGQPQGSVGRWRAQARKIALAFIQNYDADTGGAR